MDAPDWDTIAKEQGVEMWRTCSSCGKNYEVDNPEAYCECVNASLLEDNASQDSQPD